ncbi:hypothetical protein JOE11_001451 [Robbsia andropogonis]
MASSSMRDVATDMENAMILAYALAAALAWSSGLRLYLAVFLAGLAGRSGLVVLPGALHVLSSPWIIGAAVVLATAEFAADKISPLDSLWDALHTFIRIPAGAVMACAAFGHAEESSTLIAAGALGASLAGASHLTKAGVRALINLAPVPVTNGMASWFEECIVVGGLTLALLAPGVFLALLFAFLIVSAWVLPRLWRGVHHGYHAMSTRMVPARIRTDRGYRSPPTGERDTARRRSGD